MMRIPRACQVFVIVSFTNKLLNIMIYKKAKFILIKYQFCKVLTNI